VVAAVLSGGVVGWMVLWDGRDGAAGGCQHAGGLRGHVDRAEGGLIDMSQVRQGKTTYKYITVLAMGGRAAIAARGESEALRDVLACVGGEGAPREGKGSADRLADGLVRAGEDEVVDRAWVEMQVKVEVCRPTLSS
jgi:hypothetical protein